MTNISDNVTQQPKHKSVLHNNQYVRQYYATTKIYASITQEPIYKQILPAVNT